MTRPDQPAKSSHGCHGIWDIRSVIITAVKRMEGGGVNKKEPGAVIKRGRLKKRQTENAREELSSGLIKALRR